MVEVCFSHINVYWKGVPLNGFLCCYSYTATRLAFPSWGIWITRVDQGKETTGRNDSGMGRMEHGGQLGLVVGNRDYPYEVMYILRIVYCSTVITWRRDEEVLCLEVR